MQKPAGRSGPAGAVIFTSAVLRHLPLQQLLQASLSVQQLLSEWQHLWHSALSLQQELSAFEQHSLGVAPGAVSAAEA